jgi:hypothetical protein
MLEESEVRAIAQKVIDQSKSSVRIQALRRLHDIFVALFLLLFTVNRLVLTEKEAID